MMDALYLILHIEGGLGLFTIPMMDALYLILHIEGGLGLFTTTYDGRLVFNSTYRGRFDGGRFGLIYNYL